MQPYEDIAPWPPTRFTPPLSPDFPSAFDGYIDVIQAVWMRAFGHHLETWQIQAIRHALELYPDDHPRAGQLRFRQVVISLARQNGKTEIAAAVGLWALLMRVSPYVIGLATTVQQARLIYQRTMKAIKGTPRLQRLFRALTETRGIRTTSGGLYEIKPAKSDQLQGIPIDVGLVDELHLLLRELWFDLVNGLGGRPNCIVFGITTAGDEESELLLELYEMGAAAIADGASTRFGFFTWEAPEARRPDDDDTLGRYLCHANPSLASGRLDLETAIGDVRAQPEPDAVRYRLNRFTRSVNAFLTPEAWAGGTTTDPFPAGVRPAFVIDRTPDWGWASISAFAKLPDGSTYLDLVASIPRPTLSQLANIATQLSKHRPISFGVDNYSLRDLGKELEARGLPVTYFTQGDNVNAAALFYQKLTQGKLVHPGHPLLAQQIPRAVRKNQGEGFRISRAESTAEIDALMTHVLGVHLVETQRSQAPQIF